MTKTWGL